MIHEIIEHPEIVPEFTLTEYVDRLAQIDLTQDVVISFNPLKTDGNISRIVSYDIDQFVIRNHEAYHSIANNNILTFVSYPRIKLSLPNGLYPDFNTTIKGLRIRNVTFKKLQGIEFNEPSQVLECGSLLNIKFNADCKEYSFYDDFEITYEVYDSKLFNENSFKGNVLPVDQKLCNLRLVPHFTGCIIKPLADLYIICSKYIYSRLPNF